MSDAPPDPTLIFIYGSLLPNVPHSRFHLLEPARFLTQAQIPGTLYDLRGYPGAVFSPQSELSTLSTPSSQSTSWVHGEIFQLLNPTFTLPQMDDYEGFDPAHPESSEFVRHTAPALLPNGSTQIIWVYSYNRDASQLPVIPHGDYRRHVVQNPPTGR